jgi:tetratricopeptide (TPR) repeat protein
MRKSVMFVTILLLSVNVQAMAQNQPTAQVADFGDYSSQTLASKAWGALAKKDLKMVETYVNKALELYGGKAKEMQGSLKEYAWESNKKIFSYWALNDVGTSLFILGEAYQNAGRTDDARKAYNQVVKEYSYAQCWDTQGWFWKPAEAAQKKLEELGS